MSRIESLLLESGKTNRIESNRHKGDCNRIESNRIESQPANRTRKNHMGISVNMGKLLRAWACRGRESGLKQLT